MKKFSFWSNDTEEMVYIMSDDAIEAMEIAEQMFGNCELMDVVPAEDKDMEVQ